MPLPHVVIYGSRTLETACLEKYLQNQGYEVVFAPNGDGLLKAVSRSGPTVTVIPDADEQTYRELVGKVREARAAGDLEIFLLFERADDRPPLPGVRVITRPQRLSCLLEQIHSFSSAY